MDEVWRDVSDWAGRYEVSNLGRVRSVTRVVEYASSTRSSAYSRVQLGRLVRGTPHDGYEFVTLTSGPRRERRAVHRLVADAFLGPAFGDVVRHLDGDSRNNRADNLSYGTFSDNEADKARHGQTAYGTRQPKAKLRDADIQRIFEMSAQGVKQRDIGATFGVNQKTIWQILKRLTWRHVLVDAVALARVAVHVGAR